MWLFLIIIMIMWFSRNVCANVIRLMKPISYIKFILLIRYKMIVR